MKITLPHVNSRNGVSGSRITIRTAEGVIVDQFSIPTRYSAAKYFKKHPSGGYGKRYFAALAKACELDKAV